VICFDPEPAGQLKAHPIHSFHDSHHDSNSVTLIEVGTSVALCYGWSEHYRSRDKRYSNNSKSNGKKVKSGRHNNNIDPIIREEFVVANRQPIIAGTSQAK
jgi:hypothetical protein